MSFAGYGMLVPRHRCRLLVGIAQPDEMSDRAMSRFLSAGIPGVLLRWRVVYPVSS